MLTYWLISFFFFYLDQVYLFIYLQHVAKPLFYLLFFFLKFIYLFIYLLGSGGEGGGRGDRNGEYKYIHG